MRAWLWKALQAVILQGQYSNLVLKKHLCECPQKDQALATHIFYGTIQNYRLLSAVIDQYLQRKISKRVRILLAMTLYQIFFLDRVPAYAAVDEAVELVKRCLPKDAGLVNAVCHKANLNEFMWPKSSEEKLALQYSVPEWLIRMWKAQYGWAKTQDMAQWLNQTLPVYVRRNPLRSSLEDFQNESFTLVHDLLYIYHGHDLSGHPYYRQGKMSVQDAGSYAIAEFVDVAEGMQVLDCCAAPGTKSMAMAEIMKDTGAITCLDIHSHRVALIEQDAKRLGLQSVHALCKDATEIDGLGTFDRILCDVPCTGYGILARKPDIRLTMKDTDMDSLIPLQYQILTSSAGHLKDHGLLVYSTCTINKKENEKQIDRFLREHNDFELIEQKTLFPARNQDGFFMAKLVKK